MEQNARGIHITNNMTIHTEWSILGGIMLTCQPRITPVNPCHERWNHRIHDLCLTLMHNARYSSFVNCVLPVTTTTTTTKNKARNSLCQSRQTEHSLRPTPMYTTSVTVNLYDSRQLSSFYGRRPLANEIPQALSLIKVL